MAYSDPAAESVGTRVRRARKRVGITQSELARRVSRAQSWVSGIENDSIPLDSIALINTLARVLRVHPNELTARPYRGDTPAGDRGHSAIPEIRRHLERYDLDPEWVGEVRPLPELRAATEHSSWLRREARYAELADGLPALLSELQAATHLYPEPDRSTAFGLLSVIYQTADSVAYNLGYADLSLIATSRIRWAAERSGDPYHGALSAYLRIRNLWSSTSWNDALAVLDSACASIDDEYIAGQPEALAVWGGLQLRAAITAARKNDADEAWSRHRLASEAVTRLGSRQRTNYYELCTNQTNIDIHGVAIAVELGDGPQAVHRGQAVRLPKGLQANRVGYHHLDQARGLLWCGKREAALAELEHAEKAAPLLIRNHPVAQQAVRTLLDLERYSYRERIRRLGVRMHIL
ncbi:helix-turn-helix domain-containing protein [Streptosporangium lutulentum]|uniref:Transcriptional regulator with XRE-family HTH domain n=1 Tax=Streptosporangium lutulentum TaxID=1461250 RepID=A0ABT9QQF5_9ACTN|nr:helix-turn-helix transcriptional regulator [Streptosporangium lutulentum]MDP9848645.1 transcriptional regulator with XRE-family HTH domain [Streptosporangium lutulentum]